MGLAALVGTDFVVWQMAHLPADPTQMAAVSPRLDDSPAILAPLFGMSAALGLGGVLLGLAVGRAGVLPGWAALALALGPATWLAAVPSSALAIAAAVCVLAGMGTAGWLVLTDRAGGWERRPPGTAP
ncbi:MAG: hypothetical protein AABM31_12105 [Actinomycetota bacterium]